MRLCLFVLKFCFHGYVLVLFGFFFIAYEDLKHLTTVSITAEYMTVQKRVKETSQHA